MMFGICRKKKLKEEIYSNIESLIRKSFEEGTNNDGCKDVYEIIHKPDFEFKSRYLVRSECFWGIDHFLQYVKSAIEKS